MQGLLFDFEEPQAPEKEVKKIEISSISSFVPERDLKGAYSPSAPMKDRIDAAIESIRKVMADGYTCVVLCSFGKDSSVLLLCATIALRLEREAGNTKAKLVVASSLVGGAEGVLMSDFMRDSILKVKEYAQEHNLPIFMHSARPNWSENYFLQVLSGRANWSRAGQKRTCSEDMKEGPLNRMLDELDSDYDNQVGLLGMYYAESDVRREKMIERGDRNDQIRIDDEGKIYLSPLAAFNAKEIIELVGRLSVTTFGIPVEFGSHTVTDSIVDFGRVTEIYANASSSSCSIEAIREDGVKGGTGCSPRTGCHCCVHVSVDQSAKNMIENTGNRAVELLFNIREVIVASKNKLDGRAWLFKSITDDGKVKVEPSSLSPEMVKKFLRFYLTVQAETGHELIQEDELLWIGINWARYGLASALEAIAIWQDIMVDGERYYPSKEDLMPAKNVPVPRGRFYDITDEEYGEVQHGVRNLYAEAIEEVVSPDNNDSVDGFMVTIEHLESVGYQSSEAQAMGMKFTKIRNRIRNFKSQAVEEKLTQKEIDEGVFEIESTLSFTEQTLFHDVRRAIEKAQKKLSKQTVDTLLPSKNGEGFDQMDGAFFLYAHGAEIQAAHKLGPDLLPGESFKVLQRLGLHFFSNAGLKRSEQMIQRANLIYRAGLGGNNISNQKKVLEVLESDSELQVA